MAGVSTKSRFAAADDDFVAYRRNVERWTRAALATGAATFEHVLDSVHGADPIVTVHALDVIASQDGPLTGDADRIARQARATPTDPPRAHRGPLRHPLDGFWAFTPASARQLAGDLYRRTDPGQTIAYLGAPTVHAIARSGRRHVLLDVAASPDAPGDVVPIDLLRDPVPQLNAAAAIADPPWRPAELTAFLWSARAATAPGGAVLMCVPPEGAGPRAPHVRAHLEQVAGDAGLAVGQQHAEAISYMTPGFEYASLKAAGVNTVPPAWRHGDLWTFTVTTAPGGERPPAPDVEWHEVTVGDIPLRIRRARASDGPIDDDLLVALTADAPVPSVSRHNELAAETALWSSANRLYSSTDPAVLAVICNSAHARIDPVGAVAAHRGRRLSRDEQERIRAVAERVDRLCELERAEHGDGC